MILLLLACQETPKSTEAPAPEVFPEPQAMVDGHLALDASHFAQALTPFPVERLNWRTGYSPVQSAVVRLPNLRPEQVGGQAQIALDGPIQMIDLDTGTPILCFAELDAHPDAAAAPALIVRPQQSMTPGHRVAVVVHSEACQGDCAEAWPEPELKDELADLGIEAGFAWSFPISDGTAPLRAMQPAIPTEWNLELIDTDVTPGLLATGIWREMHGTFQTDNYLEDDVRLVLNTDGTPVLQGQTAAELHVYFPESLRTAAPGTVPVLVFGHGILSYPNLYFDEGDENGLIALSNRLGAIVVATLWRGLTLPDDLHAIGVAQDFGRIHELTEMLAQGVTHNRALIRLLTEGQLLDDPLFGGLADRERIYWYGISLGSIEGAVTFALQDQLSYGLLHVGGAAWSTMLERSSDWSVFEPLVQNSIPDPYDRQRLYAASQLFWDPVDPASYVADLQGKQLLWQASIHDEQVPNISTELLMRSVGVSLGTPAVTAPVGIETVALPATAPLWVQYDPESSAPPMNNRPAPTSGAHTIPRTWTECQEQVAVFFEAGAEGAVIAPCGDQPCTASNRGE